MVHVNMIKNGENGVVYKNIQHDKGKYCNNHTCSYKRPQGIFVLFILHVYENLVFSQSSSTMA